jgi:hypothetical protein
LILIYTIFGGGFKLKIAKNCLHNTNGNDETIYFELTFKSHCMHYKIVIQH